MWRFVLGGALAAGAVMMTVMAVGAGALWIWVFGDDPWPAGAETGLVVAALVAGAVTFLATVQAGRRSRVGRRRASR